MQSRRFPAPWSASRIPGGFLVSDADGCKLIYCYADFEGRSSVMGQMDAATAERVAQAIAHLPALLKGESKFSPETLTLGEIPAGPWSVEDSDGMFRVNSPGYALACIYYADRRAGDLTWDEARRIAAGISRLPKGIHAPADSCLSASSQAGVLP